MNMLNVLLGCYAGMLTAGAGVFLGRFVSDWWLSRQERRIERAEAAEKAALAELAALEEQIDHEQAEQWAMQQDRQIAERMNEVYPDWHVEVARPQFYPPLGPLPRPPHLPQRIYEAFGLPLPPPSLEVQQFLAQHPPTYPGDLPDTRPQWQRECDEIVRAHWGD